MINELAGAALAATAGAGVSYILNTIPGAREALDSVPSKYKPLAVLGLFAVLAVGAVVLQCQGLFDSGVLCPSGTSDAVKLALYTLSAFGGSQLAHVKGGGATLAYNLEYKASGEENAQG